MSKKITGRIIEVWKDQIVWYDDWRSFEDGIASKQLDFYSEDDRKKTFNWLAGLEKDDDGTT